MFRSILIALSLIITLSPASAELIIKRDAVEELVLEANELLYDSEKFLAYATLNEIATFYRTRVISFNKKRFA
ncbi:MAG: hypothetical protein JKY10_07825, partial [Cohaesibacteraceae bacterium]|nr:hypothetical protein [Cohaesibacteraceae bacterium]